METEPAGMYDIPCEAADQLGEARAHLRHAEFLMGIHELRLRSAAWDRYRKQRKRFAEREPPPPAATAEHGDAA